MTRTGMAFPISGRENLDRKQPSWTWWKKGASPADSPPDSSMPIPRWSWPRSRVTRQDSSLKVTPISNKMVPSPPPVCMERPMGINLLTGRSMASAKRAPPGWPVAKWISKPIRLQVVLREISNFTLPMFTEVMQMIIFF